MQKDKLAYLRSIAHLIDWSDPDVTLLTPEEICDWYVEHIKHNKYTASVPFAKDMSISRAECVCGSIIHFHNGKTVQDGEMSPWDKAIVMAYESKRIGPDKPVRQCTGCESMEEKLKRNEIKNGILHSDRTESQ